MTTLPFDTKEPPGVPMVTALSPNLSPHGCVVPTLGLVTPRLVSTSPTISKVQEKDRHHQHSLAAPPVIRTSSPCQQPGPSSAALGTETTPTPPGRPSQRRPQLPLHTFGCSVDPKSNSSHLCAPQKPSAEFPSFREIINQPWISLGAQPLSLWATGG